MYIENLERYYYSDSLAVIFLLTLTILVFLFQHRFS